MNDVAWRFVCTSIFQCSEKNNFQFVSATADGKARLYDMKIGIFKAVLLFSGNRPVEMFQASSVDLSAVQWCPSNRESYGEVKENTNLQACNHFMGWLAVTLDSTETDSNFENAN